MNELYTIFSKLTIEYLKGGGLEDIKTANSLEDIEAGFMASLSLLIDRHPEHLRERLHDELYFFVCEYVYAVPWNNKNRADVLALYKNAQADARNERAFSHYDALVILYTKGAERYDFLKCETLAEATKEADSFLKNDSNAESVLIISNR